VEIRQHGESDVTLEYVREEWALPRLDLARDSWVVESAGGSVVAYCLCWMETPPNEVSAEQLVDPTHRGIGLGGLLVRLCEARAAELAGAAGDDVTLAVWAHESDTRRLELLERCGYRQERAFLRLERDLDDSLEAPQWPAGITVTTFRPGVDDAAVHAAHEEAFADHYGPAEADLEEWIQSRLAHEGPDLGLWLVAWDGDQVVGGIEAMETPRGGYMGELFVRRRWRRRGIGRALMLQECAELRRRDMPHAFFAVDAANPTGALRLHGSIGFRSLRGATLLFGRRIPAG
jgi:mycothiol synthase